MNMKTFCFCIILSSLIGCFMTDYFNGNRIAENKIKGYHCTPITKHIGIESAKAQVSAYQAMIKG